MHTDRAGPSKHPSHFQSFTIKLRAQNCAPSMSPLHTVLLALVLAQATITSAKVRCPLGHYSKKGACQPCPTGTYQDLKDHTSTYCFPCKAETYSAYRGVVSEHLCIPCPLNRTSARESASCRKCPNDSVGRCGKCLRCKAGEYASPYTCRCDKCEGYYHSRANAAECEYGCPEGYRTNADNSGCEPSKCEAGYGLYTSFCSRCQFNRYSSADMLTCETCPLGTVTESRQGPNSKCIKCPPGSFVQNMRHRGADRIGYWRCVKCRKGARTNGFGKPLCRVPGRECPKGTFEDFEGDCNICPHGHRVFKGRCKPCGENRVSWGRNTLGCKLCSKNSIAKTTHCECAPGYVDGPDNTCRACSAGKFARGYCVDCPDGFSSEPGDSTCTPCPDGQWASARGNRRCETVPKCKNGYVYGLFLKSGPTTQCVNAVTGLPAARTS